MKQVFIKKGKAIVDEVPEPAISDDEVLVQVCYSCISTGTESYKLRASGRSLIKKAIDSPDNFKKVMQRVKTAGLKDALVKIKGKIEGKNPIGYSASGVVIDKGKNIKKLMKGQRVAVAGEGIANHAGFVAAPENLAVLIPEGVTLKQASTVALGSIALHSIRRCSPGTGEFATVIGLGCIGQLVSQIANVAGSRVIGIDIDNSRIERAKSLGLEFGIDASEQDCIKEVMTITGGYGSDHVLIAASSNDDSIINDSMKMCRKKGRIIIIGSVGLNIEREEFYRKELDLLISTSYGPGRYDDNYEGRQVDYPYSYVRWTENRNMDEYLRLLSKNKLLIDDLIEKIYKAEDAENAFDSLREGTMSPLITLLEYEKEPQRHRTSANEKYRPVKGKIKVGIIGAGGFTRDVHLPNLSKLKEFFSISAVCSKNGSSAAAVAEQYNAAYSTTDYQEILLDKDIDMVFIATRHNLHAPIAIEAVKSGKAVFLEKPMAINREELDILEGLIIKNQTPFMVGFNRRFSPFSVKIKDMISKRNGPMIIDYRVNAGYIQSDRGRRKEYRRSMPFLRYV